MSETKPTSQTAGRCGEKAPLVLLGSPLPPSFCVLPHGHEGWHKADDGMEWSAEPRRSAPADASWVTTCCACCLRPEHVGVWRRLAERLTPRKGSS